jgi:hypothetical protein
MTASKPTQASEVAIIDARGRPLLDVVRDIRTVLAPWAATLVRLMPSEQESDEASHDSFTGGKGNAQEVVRNRRLAARDLSAAKRSDEIASRAKSSVQVVREWSRVELFKSLSRAADHLQRAADYACDCVPSTVRVVGRRLRDALMRLHLDRAGNLDERRRHQAAASTIRALHGTSPKFEASDRDRWFQFAILAASVLDSEQGKNVGSLIDARATTEASQLQGPPGRTRAKKSTRPTDVVLLAALVAMAELPEDELRRRPLANALAERLGTTPARTVERWIGDARNRASGNEMARNVVDGWERLKRGSRPKSLPLDEGRDSGLERGDDVCGESQSVG